MPRSAGAARHQPLGRGQRPAGEVLVVSRRVARWPKRSATMRPRCVWGLARAAARSCATTTQARAPASRARDSAGRVQPVVPGGALGARHSRGPRIRSMPSSRRAGPSWPTLKSPEGVETMRGLQLLHKLAPFTDEQIWTSIQARRATRVWLRVRSRPPRCDCPSGKPSRAPIRAASSRRTSSCDG